MNQRKKAETSPKAPQMRNANTTMTNVTSQSQPIKGMVSPPKKPDWYVRNAVNQCKD